MLGNMKYEIERKVPGEIVYTKVGELNAQAGIVLTNHSYQFNNTIISPTAGIVSYRIRQIIDTAAATFTAVYIDTADVTIPGGCFATGTINPDPNKVIVTVQPNPVAGGLVNLVVETTYAVTNMPIAVYDAKGRLVMQAGQFKRNREKDNRTEYRRLAKGKYYIKVLNGSKTIGTTELIEVITASAVKQQTSYLLSTDNLLVIPSSPIEDGIFLSGSRQLLHFLF